MEKREKKYFSSLLMQRGVILVGQPESCSDLAFARNLVLMQNPACRARNSLTKGSWTFVHD